MLMRVIKILYSYLLYARVTESNYEKCWKKYSDGTPINIQLEQNLTEYFALALVIESYPLIKILFY